MGALGQSSFLGFVLACALWLLIGVVPGVLVATWLAPDRSRLERVAVAPLISIALGFAPASWLSALHLPLAWHAAWAVPLLVSVALLIAVGRRGALRDLAAPSRTAALVGLAAAASALVWVVGISLSQAGWSTVVPDQDGGSHGVFVSRILVSGSVSPSQVAVFDLADPSGFTVFYPLGLHALAAPVAALTSVASALLVPMTVLGSAVLVVGSAALARRTGGAPYVVPAAVVAAVLLPWFPFAQSFWGPVPMVLAVASVPAMVLTLLDARGRNGLAVAALAAGGLLALHTTELLVAVAVAGLAVLLSHDRRPVRALGAIAGAVAIGALVVGPVLGGLLAGGAVRPQEPPHGGDPGALLIWAILRTAFAADIWVEPALLGAALVAAIAVVVAAIVGALRVRRSSLGAAVSVVVLVCLVIGALARAGSAGPVGVPWYSNADRLASQACALLPVLVAGGWVALRERAVSDVGRRLTAGVAVALGAVLMLEGVASVIDSFSRYAVVTADDRAAYSWLAAHVAPFERVLNDHRDGSVWIYDATRGTVAPVFGPKPSGGWETVPYFDRAVELRNRIGDLETDPQVRDDARALGVRYVVVGSRRFADAAPLLDIGALESSSAFREVFSSGGARVFEIVDR